MAGTNEILPWAGDASANVDSQADYEAAMLLRERGFQTGIAPSKTFNKVWRQASFVAAAVAQFVAEQTGEDVLDDGDLPRLTALITDAVAAAGGGGGGGGNGYIFQNKKTFDVDQDIDSGNNGMSAGPIDILPGVTVTVPAGSTWTVVGD